MRLERNDMAIWSGRFGKELNAVANEFNSSIAIDHVMYREDIQGSIAHAQMLGRMSIIPTEDSEAIVAGLRSILSDLESGVLTYDPLAEDIHMFVEMELTKRIGAPGKKLHTARSRNDQVVTDLRLYLRAQTDQILDRLIAVLEAILAVAQEHKRSILPGYTHLQAAQPVTFGHHLMAYVQMLLRDAQRFIDGRVRLNECPLGAGALATTTYPIDRHMTAGLLGFDRPMRNSMDAVSDRDFVLDLEYAISICMMHLSRLSEEIIIFSSQEFGFVELDDAFSTGSSIMPQKKNPDMAELTRGKTGTVYGHLMGMLTSMKGLPLAYNKDMQEDKKGVFESVETLKKTLVIFEGMIGTLQINADVMREKSEHGFINATDLADYLARKGMPFRDAYTIVGVIVREAIERNSSLEQLPLEFYREHSDMFEEDLYSFLDMEAAVSRRNVYGGPSEASVSRQILETKEEIKKIRQALGTLEIALSTVTPQAAPNE